MIVNAPVLAALDLPLDPDLPRPLHRRLFEALRQAILSGKLGAGSRLPATRVLARELGVSRNTVIQAFEQLTAEGYVESRVGQGTRVSTLPPDRLLNVGAQPRKAAGPTRTLVPDLSERGKKLADIRRPAPETSGNAFVYGMPSVEHFPFTVWGRLLSRNSRRPRLETLGYSDSGGLRVLQRAISNYLGPARGVICRPEQVIVVGSAQGALDLAARMLLDTGDRAWIEDPGYMGARGAFVAAGASLVPVPVDDAGMDVDFAQRCGRDARLVYVTPSSQFPTGATMSLERRLTLIDWANRSDAWILEDDYDSEYRYRGRPLTAMQGLDESERVVYVGTFSKTLFPGLRLAYLVVPDSLIAPFRQALRHTGQDGSLILQAALADFIDEGHFAAHVRRMRALYAKRQTLLKTVVADYASEHLTIKPTDAGMQAVAYLGDVSDRSVAEAAKRRGVVAAPLSPHYLEATPRQGLILGYASVSEEKFAPAIRTLVEAIESVSPLSAAHQEPAGQAASC